MVAASAFAIAVRVSVLSIFAPTNATLSAPGERALRVEARGDELLVDGATRPSLRLGGAGVTIALDKITRRYPGVVEARASGGRLLLIVDVPDEEYLPGTVALEARGAHPEALAAQAIVARTYLARGSRHPGSGHHLCDLTHCQTWRGLDGETAAARAAVTSTSGQVLRHGGAIADVYFSAVCGGTTAAKADVWGGEARPYLRPVACDACRGTPEARWRADLEREVRVVERGEGGTVRTVLSGGERLRGEEFRVRTGRTLGWSVVRSNHFTVEKRGARWHLDGRGFGHRVGLCVAGAAELARRGLGHRAILERYFPGTTIGTFP